jgi:3-oxoacyl-[acyl-carrier protein] reductase
MEETMNVLIFGGSGDIGRATSEYFSSHGWHVYATYHENAPTDTATNTTWLRCDIADESSVAALFSTFQKEGLTFMAIINATSGPLALEVFHALPHEVVQRDMEICYLGAVTITQHALAHMTERGGTIIHILSSSILSPSPRMLSYTAAKAALKTVIEGIGPSLKSKGIRLIGLSPSYVETKLLAAFPPKLLEIERQKSGGSLLTPVAVAETLYDIARGTIGESGEHILLMQTREGPIRTGSK